MSTRKRTAWIDDSGEYLGVVGADSLAEMAEVIAEQRDTGDLHDALRNHEQRPVNPSDTAAVLAWLTDAPVEAVIVPSGYLHVERWDGSHIYPAEIADRPGRGRIKVLGLDVTAVQEATPMTAADQPTPRVGDTLTTAEHADPNFGPGWYEVIHPARAETCIAYVYEDGSIYFPEGEQVMDRTEFAHAASVGKAHRLIRADDAPPPSPVTREALAEFLREESGADWLSRTPEEVADDLWSWLHPAPVGDAVERAARAIARAADADYWVDEIATWEGQEQWERDAYPGERPDSAYEDREAFRTQARAALDAARAGEAVDRAALVDLLLRVGHVEWDRLDASGVADHVLALLAARGEAAPSEVEWGVRVPEFGVNPEFIARTDDRGRPLTDATAQDYASGYVTDAKVVQRTVSAWREVPRG